MTITRKTYLIGLLVILVSSYSQYLAGGLGFVFGTLVVYGIPLLVTSLIWRTAIVRKAFSHTYSALKYGLAYYGLFTVTGILAGVAVLYVIASFDPSALNLLHRPNPVLHVSPRVAWIMVCFSLLVVGPVEEFLFRGFAYGGLLAIFRRRHWLSLAFASSVFFAVAHLYYASVYDLASLVQFSDLITFGMAMAVTYYLSEGNLLIPSLIHGVYDAAGFLGVAVSVEVGALLRNVMLLAGIVVALGLFIQRILARSSRI